MILPNNNVPKSLTSFKESGFTLIEILVVILIIGILTAIAVPAFLNQRQKANDASLKSDMKNVATHIETTFIELGNFKEIMKALDYEEGYTIFINKDTPVRHTYPNNSRFWNDSELLPKISYDPGVNIETVHMSEAAPASRWAKPLSEYDFCLFGSHINGQKYDWMQGDTDDRYNHALFYDSRLGGIVEADDIFAAIQGMTDEEAAEISACHGYGFRYGTAAGL